MRPFVLLFFGVGGCSYSLVGPTPTLSGVDPSLVCGDQLTTEVAVNGAGLAPVVSDALVGEALLLPDLTLVIQTPLGVDGPPGTVIELDEAPGGDVTWASAARMNIAVTPGLALPQGIYDLTVVNPDGQEATLSPALAVVDAPTITSASTSSGCATTGDPLISVEGTGLLVVGGAPFTVTFDDVPVVPDAIGGCAPIGFGDVERCTSFTITVPDIAAGPHEVRVTNPAPAACASEVAPVEVAVPAAVLDVQPGTMCASGGSLTLTGTGFVLGSIVSLGGVDATTSTVVDATTIEATFSATGLPPGLYEVVVTSPDGCAATAPSTVQVDAAPSLYDVLPDVFYAAVEMDATLFLQGVTGTVDAVWLIEQADGTQVDLLFDATDPDRIVATIPAGLDEGPYDVFVQADGLCPGALTAAITVEADATIAFSAAEPDMVWLESSPTIDLFASDPAPVGTVQFQDVPRVWLIPQGTTGVAIELTGIWFFDPTHISCEIPPGTAPDAYDLLITNPDGTVGYAAGVLGVTVLPGPKVSAVTPLAVPFGATETIVIDGLYFRDPAIELTCRDPDTGTVTTAAAGVVASDYTSITATIPTATTGTGVCELKLTNDDGTWRKWPSIAVYDPAQPLWDWAAGPDLNVARRGAAAAIGRATPRARFLYAIGGDDGTTGGALSTIELAPIDAFGDLGPWRVLERELPAARTLAGVAQIGRFVFLVGGDDGTGPVDTFWRAEVLDPTIAPYYDGIELAYGDGTALTEGKWIYKVAALYDGTDPVNPGGESLPSDPFIANVPNVAPTMEVTITWQLAYGAIGYRIYRSPAANSASGSEEWLTDVAGISTLSFTDDGLTTSPLHHPIPLGGLGPWMELSPLPYPAVGPAVTVATAPTDPFLYYVYAAGGYDGAALHDEVSWIDVTQSYYPEFQYFGTWTSGGSTLPAPVFAAGAWTVQPPQHTVTAPGEAFVYFGGGRTSATGAGTSAAVVRGAIQTGGDLDALTGQASLGAGRAGFAVGSGADGLYAFGGGGGAATSDGIGADVLAGGSLAGWGAHPSALSTARLHAASAQEAAVIYVIGGDDGAGATVATDQSNL